MVEINIGVCVFCPATSEVFNRKTKKKVNLQPKAASFLTLLLEHKGNLVPKELIVEEVWGGRCATGQSIANTAFKIKKAFEELEVSPPDIICITKKGYLLKPSLPKCADMKGSDPSVLLLSPKWIVVGVFFCTFVLLIIAYYLKTTNPNIVRNVGMSPNQEQFARLIIGELGVQLKIYQKESLEAKGVVDLGSNITYLDWYSDSYIIASEKKDNVSSVFLIPTFSIHSKINIYSKQGELISHDQDKLFFAGNDGSYRGELVQVEINPSKHDNFASY